MKGRWETAARFRDPETAARITDCSARIRVRKEARKRAAIQTRGPRPDQATLARRPDARTAATVAGRSFRRCLRGHLLSQADLSQAGRVNRPAAAPLAEQGSAVRTALLAVRAQEVVAMVQRAVDMVEAPVRHST